LGDAPRHRSGESEYLINKSKVRLRDVLDLFLRAQVGQNSYAFMGQGLVEEVLVMRPEERRGCWKRRPTCGCTATGWTKRATA
jgi:chromosome segregation protein